MPTKQERVAAEAEKAWQKAIEAAAYERVRLAFMGGGISVSDQGGLVALIPDADGNARWYFVRLTEVRK